MLNTGKSEQRLLARASGRRCAACPPDRVCAWACVQGAGMEEIVIGAALMYEGRLNPIAPRPEQDVLYVAEEVWESYI